MRRSQMVLGGEIVNTIAVSGILAAARGIARRRR